MAEVILVDVFTCNGTGGNPCPVVVNAEGMSDREMQDIAAHYGHESGFVFPSKDGAQDFQFRFFVPNHEMEMCGHETIGALSLLAMKGRLRSDSVLLTTLSGSISGFVGRLNLSYVNIITEIPREGFPPRSRRDDIVEAPSAKAKQNEMFRVFAVLIGNHLRLDYK